MPHFSWHDYLMILSFFASIAGTALLFNGTQADESDWETTDRVLMLMTFTYWMVYCLATGVQHFILPQWEVLLWSVKLTGVLAYLLTAACMLSLPLHRVAIRQPE
ncbi:MAG: hypothetical protein KME42_03480 [Tildeniella nuda ZEHNDER 1965/U140]|jgi:hypothetical protein|nr:hypothetical protein [Tildeniella nuda ZEHNDER 1965/U140]